VAEVKREQESARCRGRPDAGEQLAHPTVAEQVPASMLSAPATIPATSAGTFSAALPAPSPETVSLSATRSANPARCAKDNTGAKTPNDNRFGSSNNADIDRPVRNSCRG